MKSAWTRLDPFRENNGSNSPAFFILEGWSQDPSITSTRQTAECFPAQILFSHTLSVWDTSDLCWQIENWIRSTERRLNWFEDICLSFSPYDSVLSFIHYVCAYAMNSANMKNMYSLLIWKEKFQSWFQYLIYLWTWTHFSARLCAVLKFNCKQMDMQSHR